MMLALIRPDSWNFPLFLHILGATLLFGTVATVAIAGFASRSHAGYEQLLARVAQRTFVLGIVPAYILMRVGAQWIDSKEFPNGDEPGWVGTGFIVSDAGVILRGRPRHRLGRDERQALERPRAADVSSSSQSAVSWASPAAGRGETAVHLLTLKNG